MIKIRLLIFLSGLACAWSLCYSASQSFDTVIVNGIVIDGSGTPRYRADIGVRNGRIIGIGNLAGADAGNTIDADGLIVSPGFIDVHTHVEHGLVDPALKENRGFVTQGVTTCVIGADGGHSPGSIKKMTATFKRQGVGTHYAFLVGTNAIRREVIGMEDRPPARDELEQMKSLVREGMELGAVGLSSALMYLPGRYASMDEVVELAKIAAEYDGLYDSHVRNAVPDFEGAYREAIETGIQSGARPHPAHYKAVGKRNWGKARKLNDYFQAEIDNGVDITVDLYPYDGGETEQLMDVFAIPPELGITDIRQQLRDPALDIKVKQELLNSRVRQLVEALHEKNKREAIRIATEVGVPGVFSIVASAAEGYDTVRIVASDRNPELEGKMLVDIAAERGVPPFDVLVNLVTEGGATTKVTMSAATEKTVIDRSTWREPSNYSEGIVHVLVDGVSVLRDGQMTGALPGKFLQRRDGNIDEEI